MGTLASNILRQVGVETDGIDFEFFNGGGFFTDGRKRADKLTKAYSTAKWKIGTRYQNGPRVFRFGLSGAGTLAAGKLCSSPQYGGNIAAAIHNVVAAGTLGEKTITLTIPNTSSADVVANQYTGGFVYTVSGTGLGQCYQIKSHPAAILNTTCVFTLYDTVRVTLASTPKGGAITSPYYKVITAPASTAVGIPVGVPLVALTTGKYGWFQTWGPCVCLITGNVAIGDPVLVGLSAGAAIAQEAGASSLDEPQVGLSPLAYTTGQYGLINLTIAP